MDQWFQALEDPGHVRARRLRIFHSLAPDWFAFDELAPECRTLTLGSLPQKGITISELRNGLEKAPLLI